MSLLRDLAVAAGSVATIIGAAIQRAGMSFWLERLPRRT